LATATVQPLDPAPKFVSITLVLSEEEAQDLSRYLNASGTTRQARIDNKMVYEIQSALDDALFGTT
jgi:hypothetical protein